MTYMSSLSNAENSMTTEIDSQDIFSSEKDSVFVTDIPLTKRELIFGSTLLNNMHDKLKWF